MIWKRFHYLYETKKYVIIVKLYFMAFILNNVQLDAFSQKVHLTANLLKQNQFYVDILARNFRHTFKATFLLLHFIL